jgi:hypothetical protein
VARLARLGRGTCKRPYNVQSDARWAASPAMSCFPYDVIWETSRLGGGDAPGWGLATRTSQHCSAACAEHGHPRAPGTTARQYLGMQGSRGKLTAAQTEGRGTHPGPTLLPNPLHLDRTDLTVIIKRSGKVPRSRLRRPGDDIETFNCSWRAHWGFARMGAQAAGAEVSMNSAEGRKKP